MNINKKQDKTFTIIAVGDIIIERDLQDVMRTKGSSYLFEKINPYLSSGNIVFGNFENPIADLKDNAFFDKRISYCSDPMIMDGLISSGFNILNIASNHMMDYGKSVLTSTIDILDENKIKHIGAGITLAEARKPAMLKQGDVNVAFLGYQMIDEETNATDSSAGTAPFDELIVIEDVKKARSIADIVIVSVHDGKEFVYYPEPLHQAKCRKIIDAGADIILGHHPHFIQGVEQYNKGLIFYSLGSFIIDYESPLTSYEQTLFLNSRKNNISVKFHLSKEGVTSYEIVPVFMNNSYQAEKGTGHAKDRTLQLVSDISSPLNRKGKTIDDIFWKECKNYLAIQFPSFLSKVRQGNLKAFIGFLRWLTKDDIIRMIIGYLFRVNISGSFLVLKNSILGICIKSLKFIKLKQ